MEIRIIEVLLYPQIQTEEYRLMKGHYLEITNGTSEPIHGTHVCIQLIRGITNLILMVELYDYILVVVAIIFDGLSTFDCSIREL